jgi:hypothetical protein
MELSELYGATLTEINRKHREVVLIFERNHNFFKLKYEGFFLETEISPMGQKIRKVSLTSSLGIKALELLRYYNFLDRHEYKQIFIEFEGHAFKKNEIYCICKSYSLINF